MNKKIIFGVTAIFLILISFLIYTSFMNKETDNSLGNNQIKLIVFYGQGCPHCAALNSFLEDIKKQNSNLVIEEYEVYFNEKNRKLLNQLSEVYNTEVQGVPTIFIDNKILVGFSSSVENELKQEITRCGKENCIYPLDKITESSAEENPASTELNKKITIPAVVSAAFVDSINPCEFAVLIILLTTILASGTRKKALLAGLAFSLSIFISYFLMGLGLYSAIQASGLTHKFYIIVSILAIIIGLFNLKDYLWYGKWFLMEVPLSWRPRMKSFLKSIASVPGAFLVGFVISLFLLPCTSGPYIVILGLLANLTTKNYAVLLLILYNIIFILPMLGITFGIYSGLTTPEKAEDWRIRKLKKLHLIAGIIILLLGIGMIISILMGWI